MATSLLLLACLYATPPDAWPNFLGQGHTPLSADSIPMRWSFDDTSRWEAPLPGKGQSSPNIRDGRVYVTSIEGTMKDHSEVPALNLSDGSAQWNVTLDASQMVRSNYFQSWSAPTPCANEHAVYVFFEIGNLLAISHAGEIRWRTRSAVLEAVLKLFAEWTGLDRREAPVRRCRGFAALQPRPLRRVRAHSRTMQRDRTSAASDWS